MTDGPLIVQSDKTLLLEIDHPLSERAEFFRKGRAGVIHLGAGYFECVVHVKFSLKASIAPRTRSAASPSKAS